MRRHAILTCITGLWFALGGPVTVEAQPRGSTAITGTIRLHGCELQPADLVLRAAPIIGFSPDTNLLPPSPGRAADAQLTRTRDPHRLRFRFENLESGKVYRLRVRVDSPACGRVFWRGPVAGLASPGGRPVTIVGFAVRSHLEVLGPPVMRPRAKWVGADALDFNDPRAGIRSFRWKTDLEDAVAGELQVTTTRFQAEDASLKACQDPVGLIHRKKVALRHNAWASIAPVDFHEMVNQGVRRSAIDAETLEYLQHGAPLYVRVVPVSARGPMCNAVVAGLSSWVILGKAQLTVPPQETPPETKFVGLFYQRPKFEAGFPGMDSAAYRVIKDTTLPYCSWFSEPKCQALPPLVQQAVIMYGPNATLPRGKWFGWEISEDGFDFEDIVDAIGAPITAFIDAAGALVKVAGDIIEAVKSAVVKVAAGALDSLKIVDCKGGSACEGLVRTALNTGLVAMGLPPSLPNFDDLKNIGVDYLAAQIQSQTGIPPSVTEFAAEQIAMEVMKRVDENRGLPDVDWLVPTYVLDPGILKVTLERTSSGKLENESLYFLDLSDAPGQHSDVFINKKVKLPAKFPKSKKLEVPIVLEPSIFYLRILYPPPTVFLTTVTPPHWEAVHFKQIWLDKSFLATPCFDLHFSLSKSVFSSWHVKLPMNYFNVKVDFLAQLQNHCQ